MLPMTFYIMLPAKFEVATSNGPTVKEAMNLQDNT